jgi:hypothetical protein
MVRQNKLDASWGKELKQNIVRKPVKNTYVWEVMVNNPQEKDAAKQNLYLYLDEMGNSVGVSYTEKK